MPLLLPDVGLVVNHAAFEVTVQEMLELTVMLKLPAVLVTDWVVGVTLSEAGAAWAIVAVRVIPPPVKVSVPVRAVPVLAVKLAVTVPLLLPEFGLMVSQVALELTVQATLDVTLMFAVPAWKETAWLVGATVRLGAAV